MKNIVILGSTGSIGTNTLDIVRRMPDQFRVVGLTAATNGETLKTQIREFHPLTVALSDEGAASQLRDRCKDVRVEILSGMEGVEQVARLPEAELAISAIVGAAGLMPTLAAIRAGKHVALANKEPMVMAGQLMQEEARKQGVRIFPVDSEHSAIFQSLEGHRREDVRRLILTASGGPLWDLSREHMQDVKPEHPKLIRHSPLWSGVYWADPRASPLDSGTGGRRVLDFLSASGHVGRGHGCLHGRQNAWAYETRAGH